MRRKGRSRGSAQKQTLRDEAAARAKERSERNADAQLMLVAGRPGKSARERARLTKAAS